MKKTVLITGGTGFVGSHLTEFLSQDQNLDIHLTAFGPKPDFFSNLISDEKIHNLDLTDFQATTQLIKVLKPDQIYHLASFAAVGNSFEQAEKILINNTILQLNLLEALKIHSPKSKVLSICSADEYGLSLPQEIPINETHELRPVNPYAVSKISQDMLAHAYHVSFGLNIVRVRPFNHIGERQTVAFAVSAFAKQIAQIEAGQLKTLKVGNLQSVRDFTDVKDMVIAYNLLMEKGVGGQVYNVGSGQGLSMSEVLNLLVKLAKKPVVIEQDQARMRPSDIQTMVADNSKITALGWCPRIPLKQTLQRVLDYWRAQL